MHVDSTRTLLLDQGYQPIRIVSWQRAITLIALDKVDVLEQYELQIRAPSQVVQAPAVVRLRRSYRWHPKPVKFSRINLYARDDYRCQYCGEQCAIDQWKRLGTRPEDRCPIVDQLQASSILVTGAIISLAAQAPSRAAGSCGHCECCP